MLKNTSQNLWRAVVAPLTLTLLIPGCGRQAMIATPVKAESQSVTAHRIPAKDPFAELNRELARVKPFLRKQGIVEGNAEKVATAIQNSASKLPPVSSMEEFELVWHARYGVSWSEWRAQMLTNISDSEKLTEWKFDFPVAQELQATLTAKKAQFEQFNNDQKTVVTQAEASLTAFTAQGAKIEELQGNARQLFANMRQHLADIIASVDELKSKDLQGDAAKAHIAAMFASEGVIAAAVTEFSSRKSLLDSFSAAFPVEQQELIRRGEDLKQKLKELADLHPDVGPLLKAASDQIDKSVQMAMAATAAMINPLLGLLMLIIFALGGGGSGSGDGSQNTGTTNPGNSDTDEKGKNDSGKDVGSGKEPGQTLPSDAQTLAGVISTNEGDFLIQPYDQAGKHFLKLSHKTLTEVSATLRFDIASYPGFEPLETARKGPGLTIEGVHHNSATLYPITMQIKSQATEWKVKWTALDAEPILLTGFADTTPPPDQTRVPVELADSLENGDHSYSASRDKNGQTFLRIWIKKQPSEQVELLLPVDQLQSTKDAWKLTAVRKLGPSAATAFPVELGVSIDGTNETSHRVLWPENGKPPQVIAGSVGIGG